MAHLNFVIIQEVHTPKNLVSYYYPYKNVLEECDL